MKRVSVVRVWDEERPKLREILEMIIDTLGKSYEVGKRVRHPVAREFYADREYDKSSSIVFARHVSLPTRQIKSPQKYLRARKEEGENTVDGTTSPSSLKPFAFTLTRSGHWTWTKQFERA
jgi:UPF0271 protein